ncbi:MAG: hypothetical protein AMS19_04230 [Gemmatimonas sp. SG8_23]|nr:MAG: hypothetical protein AMS19_04230 [Gemmatimonas sp. SG8_23]
MNLLEFLLVLISVVIGLGLAEILSGVAGLLRARRSVRSYWIHSLFQCGIFLALVQQWWESWGFRGIAEISYGAMLVFLSAPVVLFLIAHLLYPQSAEDADLRGYYYEQAPILWGLVFLGTFIGTFLRPLSFGDPILEPSNLSGLPTMIFAVVLVRSTSPRVHALVAPLMLLILVLDTLLAAAAIRAG